ncbi:hypothetical protein B0H10DRAFT_2211119 [Mycena sp. CBHHK59/15]|nr:hypothetical protein B0H10DRAFT_2211119 [Mycena sp. CBHHK59/15]
MTDVEMTNKKANNFEPEENKGQWQKNLAYCTTVVGVLYKIHISMLTKLSPDMGSILSIPDGKDATDPTHEGTELFPLLLLASKSRSSMTSCTGFTVEWKPMDNLEEKEHICTNLLKVSDLWQIDMGKAYAIRNLKDMYLLPSRRLELAGKFSIPEWVEPAVMAIFEGKLSDLTDMDLLCIGLKVYSILVRGMERMEIEIKRTANVEPRMVVDPDCQCQNHGACIAAWKRLWWDKIGRKLLHPDKPMKTDTIIGEVIRFAHKDLNERCRDDMVREI